MSLQTLQEDTPLAASKPLDVVEHYKQLLKGDDVSFLLPAELS